MTLMYLEDYLELISFLPQEFKDRLTKMRELDLEASICRDNVDKLKAQLRKPADSVKSVDSTGPGQPDRTATTQQIQSEYDKVIQVSLTSKNGKETRFYLEAQISLNYSFLNFFVYFSFIFFFKKHNTLFKSDNNHRKFERQ